jgi:GT2 family glycosyltransferase
MTAVSVLMTTFNAGGYLQVAVESLLAQTHSDWELILVDNGSTDCSIESMGLTDPRIRLLTLRENIGRTPALKLALENAQHPYVAVLDADDVCRRDRLEIQSRFLDDHSKFVLVGSGVDVIDTQGQVTGVLCLQTGTVSQNALAERNVFVNSSLMYRRQAALAIGGYDPRFEFAQDYHLILRIASQGECYVLPESLTLFRVSPSSYTKSARMRLVRSMDEVELFRLAPEILKLSAEGIQLNRRRQAISNAALAFAAIREHQYRLATTAICSALRADPRMTWIRYLVQGRQIPNI